MSLVDLTSFAIVYLMIHCLLMKILSVLPWIGHEVCDETKFPTRLSYFEVHVTRLNEFIVFTLQILTIALNS